MAIFFKVCMLIYRGAKVTNWSYLYKELNIPVTGWVIFETWGYTRKFKKITA